MFSEFPVQCLELFLPPIKAVSSDIAAANKTGHCSHCKPMQADPPSLLKCEKSNKTLNSSLASSQCVLLTLQGQRLMNVVSS